MSQLNQRIHLRLSYLICGMGLVLGITIAYAWNAIFGLAEIVVILVICAAIARRGIQITDIFSPAFVVSSLLTIYALSGVMFYVNGLYPEDTLVVALTYLVLFVTCYVIGLSTRLGNTLARHLPRLQAHFSIERLKIVTLLFLPSGLALFAYLMYRSGIGNPLAVFEHLLLFRESLGTGGLEYLLIGSFFLIEAPFWAWIVKGQLSISGRMGVSLYWLLILMISVLTGTRSRVYSAVMGLAFVYHCTRKRISLSKALVLGVLILIPFSVFYKLQGTMRGQSTTAETLVGAVHDVDITQSVTAMTMRFADAFEGFVKVIDQSEDLNLLWGKSFYDALFLPIPRAWMPDKPYSFNSQMLRQLYPELQGQFYGEEYSLLGELYMNFHVVGIILGGWIFGVIIKMAQRCYIENQTNPAFVFLYRPLIMLPMVWMTSGLINSEAHAILILNLLLGVVFIKLSGSHGRGRMWEFRLPKTGMARNTAPTPMQ